MFGRKRHEAAGDIASAPDETNKWEKMATEAEPMATEAEPTATEAEPMATEASADKTEMSEEERALEESRDRYIGLQIIGAVGGMDRIREAVIARNRGNARGVSTELHREFREYTANMSIGRSNYSDSRYAAAAYRAGLLTLAGSKEGLAKASKAELDWSQSADQFGLVIDNSELPARDLRVMQIGVRAMEKRFKKAIDDAVSRVAPDHTELGS